MVCCESIRGDEVILLLSLICCAAVPLLSLICCAVPVFVPMK